MQKKLIALAVVSMMSGAAFAQSSSVTLGGKFDACYAFSRAQGGGSEGQLAPTKEAQTDGCNSTSRVTIGAKESIAPGYDVRVDYDIRFGNVHEGKSGLASNDKKAMAFTTPFGTMQWGTANLMSNDYKLAEKPYMVTPKDTELVKFGVSQLREESLTSRNTSYWSPTLSIGPVKTLVKASYAFGDARKAGSNDAAASGSADAMSIGSEGVVLDGLLDWGLDYTYRAPYVAGKASGYGAGGFGYSHAYLNIRPIPGNKNLKLTTAYNVFRGYTDKTSGSDLDVREKNTNFVVSYNFNDKAEIGVGIAHLNDVAQSRNSGKSLMLGGSYFVSKSVQLYAGIRKDDFARNEAVVKSYVGTGTNFAGSVTKQDQTVVKVGIMKEF